MVSSDKIEAALIADGWNYARHSTLTKPILQKRIENFAPAGSLSNGARIVTIEIFGNSIYRVDGWGDVERAKFMADFYEAADIIKAVLS
jgi:hypothetical protein